MQLDEAVISHLPLGCEVISVNPKGLSENCDTTEIEIRLEDGSIERYFEKSSTGQHGFELMRAHYESETSLYRFIPENLPPPIALIQYKSDPDRHSFLMKFVDMVDDELPDPAPFMETIATLHRKSAGKSPTGRFGFSVDTKFAHLATPNFWDDSWESWWTRHMKMVLERELQERGTRTQEEDDLVDFYLTKAIPRYIRPLESDGRSIQPTLLHTDLWPGNVKFKPDYETVCIFDANAMWGHNEMELGLVANPRYPLGKAYIEEYRKRILPSAPEQDADSRVIMYMIRHQACLASVYPDDVKLREIWIENVRILLEQYLLEERIKANTEAIKANQSIQTMDQDSNSSPVVLVTTPGALATQI
ncbi:Fructosamine kinase-domain-containing protein [Xylaria bambusicola]|uniref:Fructosamine kinase-domain-containing protein n=1 Tax=Xylaria bambusicola TaxID=326684 RepID=UPI0020086399|nr:Fructosamine kinase-domain-containing protein [Xylaria bambusicola]KAI0523867.1 Fructosamine kinase-domain-containing protein [Xylaria bambusicola]